MKLKEQVFREGVHTPAPTIPLWWQAGTWQLPDGPLSLQEGSWGLQRCDSSPVASASWAWGGGCWLYYAGGQAPSQLPSRGLSGAKWGACPGLIDSPFKMSLPLPLCPSPQHVA